VNEKVKSRHWLKIIQYSQVYYNLSIVRLMRKNLKRLLKNMEFFDKGITCRVEY